MPVPVPPIVSAPQFPLSVVDTNVMLAGNASVIPAFVSACDENTLRMLMNRLMSVPGCTYPLLYDLLTMGLPASKVAVSVA